MSDSLHDDASQLAKQRLTNACRTKDTSVRLAWAITVGEAVLLGIAAVALMDYWLMLPVGIRSGAAAVLALFVAAGLWRLVKFFRRPTPLKEAALDVEARRPELGCEISTAAEYLSGERQVTHQYEPELVAALETRAADQLGQTQLPYERRLLRPAILLALTVLGLIGLLLAEPGSFTALTRAALPFSKARYTQVEVQPGSIDIPVGRDVEITNLFTGRAPKNPEFHWQQLGQSAWQAAPLTVHSNDGAFIYSLKNVHTDLKYQVTGNDAASPVYDITTFIPPAVKDLNVQIEFPSYTKLQPATQKSGDISVVRASKVQIQVDPSVKLATAKLRFSNGTNELTLRPTPEGAWVGNFDVSKDADYWIDLADEKGHRGGDDKPHHIKAIPDTPPKVEIEEPNGDMRASATNKVPVKISVADDFGVDDVQLVFHKLGGTDQTVSAKREVASNGEVTATAEVDLSTLDLKDYELVAYHAEAKDNNTLDGPGKGQSPVYFVEITNLEAGECKPKVPGKKLNLLDVQKQIIADTTALPTDAAAEKFTSLAARQRDAADFGNTYLSGLTASGAPASALTNMQTAIKEMTEAGTHLDSRLRSQALPPEESALAHLYQVLKELPELQNVPTPPKPPGPPSDKLAIALDPIKQKKQAQQKPDETAVQDALAQAQGLASAQSDLNSALRKIAEQLQSANETNRTSAGLGDGKTDSQSEQMQLAKADSKDAMGQGQNGKKGQAGQKGQKGKGKGKGQGKGQGKGKGQGQGQGEGEGQGQAQAKGEGKGKGQGQGQGQGDGQEQNDQPQVAEESTPPDQAKDPSEIAQQEQQLSKEAKDLADKLQRLAGNDKRVGHKAGQNAHIAGQKIATASDEIKQGNFGAAGVNGFQGELALREVIAQLEQIVREKPELTDVANEDAPKEYEGLISEYFKKLSHAE